MKRLRITRTRIEEEGFSGRMSINVQQYVKNVIYPPGYNWFKHGPINSQN